MHQLGKYVEILQFLLVMLLAVSAFSMLLVFVRTIASLVLEHMEHKDDEEPGDQ